VAAIKPEGRKFKIGIGKEIALAAGIILNMSAKAVTEEGEVSLESTRRDLEAIEKLLSAREGLAFQTFIKPIDSFVTGH